MATAWLSPPTPVVLVEHGVRAAPLYVTSEQLTVVVELALSIVNVAMPLLPEWFASPA